MNEFFRFLLAMFALFLADMSVTFMKKRNAKKCNYDCSKCKNWDCWSSYCKEKREGDNKK